MLLKSTLLLALLSSSVHGWGDEGHEAVGYIAQGFLTPQALAFVQNVLDPQYDGQLALASTWADKIKRTRGWTWTSTLHYVDAHDDPINGNCNLDDRRDCKGGCILSAISNYTVRLQDPSLSDEEHDIAIKFLTHFIGDIGQPLHCEDYQKGGNGIKAKFDGRHTELHAIWDTSIPEKTIKEQFRGSVEAYATSITSRIQSGDLSADAASWISCTDPTLPSTTGAHPLLNLQGLNAPLLSGGLAPRRGKNLRCPVIWAQESNALGCSAVFNGYDEDDLGGDYYTANAPIVDVQIAKSGYRLATWLNSILDGAAQPGQ